MLLGLQRGSRTKAIETRHAAASRAAAGGSGCTPWPPRWSPRLAHLLSCCCSAPAGRRRSRARASTSRCPSVWGSTGPTGPWCRPTASASRSPRGPRAGVQLWVRALDGAVQPLADTEGAAFAFWSPDSRAIAFFAGGKLKRVDVAGGPVTCWPTRTAWAAGRGAGRHDPLRAAVERADHAVAEGGGASRAVTALDPAKGETGHRFSRFLPDGRHFLFTAAGRQPGVYAASLDGGRRQDVLRSVDRDDVRAARVPALQPPTDADGAAVRRGGGSSVRGTAVADCRSGRRRRLLGVRRGTLVYRPGGGSQNNLVWIGRDGRAPGRSAHRRTISRSCCRPAAAARRCSASTRIPATPTSGWWTSTPASRRAMTLDPAMDGDPAWSPDERSLAFTTFRAGPGTVWLWDFVSGRESPLFDLADRGRPIGGAGGRRGPTSLAPARIPEGIAVDDWTRDGKYLVVRTLRTRAVLACRCRAIAWRGCWSTRRLSKTRRRSRPTAAGSPSTPTSPAGGRCTSPRFPGFTQKRQVSQRRRDAAAVAARRRGAVLPVARRHDDGRGHRPARCAGRCPARRARCSRRT